MADELVYDERGYLDLVASTFDRPRFRPDGSPVTSCCRCLQQEPPRYRFAVSVRGGDAVCLAHARSG